jgi:hypothetical protein
MKRLASSLTGLIFLALSCLLSLPALAQAIPTGVAYSFKVHDAPSNKNWTGALSFSTVGSSVKGQLEWPSERSVHRIEGSYNNGVLNFREVSAIKPGSAHLNCVYTLKYQAASRSFSGSWYEAGKEKKYNGSATFALADGGSTDEAPAAKATPATKARTATRTAPASKPSSSSATLPLSTGVGYAMRAGDNKSGKTWSASITFSSVKGSVAGQIEWTSLGSIHGFTGNFDGDTLSFEETRAVRSGKAKLNCSYRLKYFPDEQMFEGPWSEPGHPDHAAGVAAIYLARAGKSGGTSGSDQPADAPSGQAFQTVHASVKDITGTAIDAPGDFKVPSGKNAANFQVVQLTGGVDDKARAWSIKKSARTVYSYSQYPSSSASENPPLATLLLEPGSYRVHVTGTRGAAVTVRYQLVPALVR